MCGEKWALSLLYRRSGGSPPRVRGEGFLEFGETVEERITPACAGRSCTGSRPRPRLRDHPRVCGEKDYVILCCTPELGSPPRVRGEVLQATAGSPCKRITPACAGRRRKAYHLTRFRGDHPRVCGEKSMSTPKKRRFSGSPPRVRGEAFRASECTITRRITPACAGRRNSQIAKSVLA